MKNQSIPKQGKYLIDPSAGAVFSDLVFLHFGTFQWGVQGKYCASGLWTPFRKITESWHHPAGVTPGLTSQPQPGQGRPSHGWPCTVTLHDTSTDRTVKYSAAASRPRFSALGWKLLLQLLRGGKIPLLNTLQSHPWEGPWETLPPRAFAELLKLSLISGIRIWRWGKQFTAKNEYSEMTLLNFSWKSRLLFFITF